MPAILSVFEIDAETTETTGQVHPFCSDACLEAGFEDLRADVHSRGFMVVISESAAQDHCDGAVCEECRAELV